MFEVVVTFVKTEPMDISRAEMDTRIAGGEPIEYAVTEVHRLEFEAEQYFRDWMDDADANYAISSHKLNE